MLAHRVPYIWKKMPFVRIVIPFLIGILLQWYLKIEPTLSVPLLVISVFISLIISLLHINIGYTLRWVQGAAINISIIALAMLLTYGKDSRNHADWVGHHYKDSGAVIISLLEPPVTKPKSFKADASIQFVQSNGAWQQVQGELIVYLQKDSAAPPLDYGSKILFIKPLQPIKNSGNPGAFDYARFNLFKGITHQVYLKTGEYKILPASTSSDVTRLLIDIRQYVIGVLQTYITGPEESGVAEALLIGYRNDLDKDLVQAYSNTGVVHIIAISGMHLAMIYGILAILLKWIKPTLRNRILKAVVILSVLWIFALVAGGAASIVRSAVMFTGIVLGDLLNKKGSIYNTLAAAAFVMLCNNPFVLWDVGFQLSFTAVLSIVVFMQPIYKLVFVKNKLMDSLWQLSAVTLSAQVLTSPLIFYYFHQFPLLFMVSNFVAVPLSTIILTLELILIAVSPIAFVAQYAGQACSLFIWLMNTFIRKVDQVPYALYDNVQVNLLQAWLIFLVTTALGCWLLRKWKVGLPIAGLLILTLVAVNKLESYSLVNSSKVVIYNIPQHHAIDFIYARSNQFVGDAIVASEPMLQNFHLKPARINFGIQSSELLPVLSFKHPFIHFNEKKLLVIDKPQKFVSAKKIKVDVIVLANNPKIYISNLHKTFDCDQYVFDASNPQWKINLWKKDCDSLHLRHHSTPDKGAFVMEL